MREDVQKTIQDSELGMSIPDVEQRTRRDWPLGFRHCAKASLPSGRHPVIGGGLWLLVALVAAGVHNEQNMVTIAVENSHGEQ